MPVSSPLSDHMRLPAPLASYRGVALRSRPTGDGLCFEVTLAHSDPALDAPLFAADDCDDIIAEWRGLARALNFPALIGHGGGVPASADSRLGSLIVSTPLSRRRRRSMIAQRRPSALLRRKTGGKPTRIVREREIIARS